MCGGNEDDFLSPYSSLFGYGMVQIEWPALDWHTPITRGDGELVFTFTAEAVVMGAAI